MVVRFNWVEPLIQPKSGIIFYPFTVVSWYKFSNFYQSARPFIPPSAGQRGTLREHRFETCSGNVRYILGRITISKNSYGFVFEPRDGLRGFSKIPLRYLFGRPFHCCLLPTLPPFIPARALLIKIKRNLCVGDLVLTTKVVYGHNRH